jgi:hypothetical protein
MRTRFLLLSAFAFLLSTISPHADSVVYNTFGPGFTTNSLYGKLIDLGGSFLGTPFSPSMTVDLISLTGSWDSSPQSRRLAPTGTAPSASVTSLVG